MTASESLLIVILILLSSLTQAQNNPFELIFMTDEQTWLTGSILLICRDTATTELLEVDQTKFWLNRTSDCDPDLTTRAEMRVMTASNGIKFNLTRNLEGFYTCGRLRIQENEIFIEESTPKPLICKFRNIFMVIMHAHAIINFTMITVSEFHLYSIANHLSGVQI